MLIHDDGIELSAILEVPEDDSRGRCCSPVQRACADPAWRSGRYRSAEGLTEVSPRSFTCATGSLRKQRMRSGRSKHSAGTLLRPMG